MSFVARTRTREKYRMVYTDFQRLELEKEFCYNKYISTQRKLEMSRNLSLSERQIKIWYDYQYYSYFSLYQKSWCLDYCRFQNRRAKERKIQRKNVTNTNDDEDFRVKIDPAGSDPTVGSSTMTVNAYDNMLLRAWVVMI